MAKTQKRILSNLRSGQTWYIGWYDCSRPIPELRAMPIRVVNNKGFVEPHPAIVEDRLSPDSIRARIERAAKNNYHVRLHATKSAALRYVTQQTPLSMLT